MMKLYLMDQGMDVPSPITEENVKRMDEGTIRFYDHFINALGEDTFKELAAQEGKSIPQVRREWWAAHGEAFENAYREYMSDLGFTDEEMENVLNNETVASQTRKALEMRNYILHGPETRTVTENISATKDAIKAAVDKEAYSKWLHGLFDGLEKSTGIYNGRDRFTASGDRRSFSATHDPVTLENIAKIMSKQNEGNSRNVDGFYGIKSLRAGMAERFSSIERMHELEGRLQHLTEEEAQQISDALSNRMTDLFQKIYDSKTHSPYDNSFIEMDAIGDMVMEATETRPITIDAIVKAFKGSGYKVGNELAAQLRDLLFDVSQMPVNIFEAKPERAVRFNEVLAAIVPEGTDSSLIESLKNSGVENVMEYAKGDDADRLAKVNSVEEARFSIKDDKQLQNRIKPDMDEQDRYDILKDRTYKVIARPSSKYQDVLTDAEKNVIASGSMKNSKAPLKRLARNIGALKEYHHEGTDLYFNFSSNNFDESVFQQSSVKISERYVLFGKMLTCLDDIVDTAELIESHTPSKDIEDKDLNYVHTFISA
ncbi:MAG: hypothetical protein II971_01205 [Firmicutes bacterium]|nr:hypothetical protein [Bacillota bacterium]